MRAGLVIALALWLGGCGFLSLGRDIRDLVTGSGPPTATVDRTPQWPGRSPAAEERGPL